MYKITILAIGSLKEKYFKQAIAEYQKRLSLYTKLEIAELKAEKFSDGSRAKAVKIESERLLQYFKKRPGSLVIVCDERGEEFTSTELAEKLKPVQREIILVIGGSLGLSDEVKRAGEWQLALSKLTLPHELARVVLLEQLYRAMTIISGKTYHY